MKIGKEMSHVHSTKGVCHYPNTVFVNACISSPVGRSDVGFNIANDGNPYLVENKDYTIVEIERD